MRWTTTGARVRCRVARWWRRDARGCRCTAEPPVDATARKPLQRSTLAFASPLLLALSLASLFLSLSLFLSARSSSLPPVLFSRPYQPSAASLFLALSLLLLPRVLTRLVTPPFSLHPRSMTSVRGNAPQRRLLSLAPSLNLSLSLPFTRSPTSRFPRVPRCTRSLAPSHTGDAVCLHRCGTFNRDRFVVVPTLARAPTAARTVN